MPPLLFIESITSYIAVSRVLHEISHIRMFESDKTVSGFPKAKPTQETLLDTRDGTLIIFRNRFLELGEAGAFLRDLSSFEFAVQPLTNYSIPAIMLLNRTTIK